VNIQARWLLVAFKAYYAERREEVKKILEIGLP
jgi:hypothetical protein